MQKLLGSVSALHIPTQYCAIFYLFISLNNRFCSASQINHNMLFSKTRNVVLIHDLTYHSNRLVLKDFIKVWQWSFKVRCIMDGINSKGRY